MDKINTQLRKLKEGALDLWYDFVGWTDENRKEAIIGVVGVFITMCLFATVMVTGQSHIRASQYEDLVFNQLTSDKIQPLNYGKEAAKIQSTPAISVMFSKPNGKEYHQVLDIISEKQKGGELNRTFYYYPLVYSTKEIQQKYKVSPDEVTFVFFEKGKEKNRFVLADMADFEEEFIPELNRLPMWSIRDLDEDDGEK